MVPYKSQKQLWHSLRRFRVEGESLNVGEGMNGRMGRELFKSWGCLFCKE